MTKQLKHRDERWLREQYIVEGRTVPDLADELGVSVAAVCKWMERYGIDCGRGPTPDNTDYRDEEWLREMYVERHLSVYDIADACDVTISTISRWLNKHGIETRDRGSFSSEDNPMYDDEVVESHPITGQSGEDHPFHKGEPDGWRKRQPWIGVRKAVINRDGESCVVCGTTRQEHFDEHGQDLDVHHIVPTSEGGRKYVPENLATLCRPCHSDTHVNRNNQNEPTAEQDWIDPETAEYGGA